MPAKYWLPPLFALAVLAFAAHGPGEELLERLAALGRRNGAISFTA
jgi:hypothetical protein